MRHESRARMLQVMLYTSSCKGSKCIGTYTKDADYLPRFQTSSATRRLQQDASQTWRLAQTLRCSTTEAADAATAAPTPARARCLLSLVRVLLASVLRQGALRCTSGILKKNYGRKSTLTSPFLYACFPPPFISTRAPHRRQARPPTPHLHCQ